LQAVVSDGKIGENQMLQIRAEVQNRLDFVFIQELLPLVPVLQVQREQFGDLASEDFVKLHVDVVYLQVGETVRRAHQQTK